jgi:hypothetical protein
MSLADSRPQKTFKTFLAVSHLAALRLSAPGSIICCTSQTSSSLPREVSSVE